VNARPESLARIAAFVADVARRWGLTPQETFDVQMAVDEACANVIQHAYRGDESGLIELAVACDGKSCTVTIRDHGAPFDPGAVLEPDTTAPLEERPIGGLGLFFMRRLMDEVHFQFDERTGNVLTMVKHRQRGPEAGETTTP
jgi:serine/threonine-protein kinase RsbW